MVTPNRQLMLEVIDHEEFVEVTKEIGPTGEPSYRTVKGTETSFLHLKAPDGRIIRAQIPYEDLDPVLAMIIPDFHG